MRGTDPTWNRLANLDDEEFGTCDVTGSGHAYVSYIVNAALFARRIVTRGAVSLETVLAVS